MLTFLNGDVPQDFVFLPQLLQNVIPGNVGTTVFIEFCTIGGIFGILLDVYLAGCEVTRVDLSDGFDGVPWGWVLHEGGDIFVDLFEGFLHFYFGTSQHH